MGSKDPPQSTGGKVRAPKGPRGLPLVSELGPVRPPPRAPLSLPVAREPRLPPHPRGLVDSGDDVPHSVLHLTAHGASQGPASQ